MSTFKVGDLVRRKWGTGGNGFIAEGKEFIVYGLDPEGFIIDSYGKYHYAENLELVKNNKIMNTLEKFSLAFKKEPEKSYRKAGITNGDDLLTDEGTKVFLSYLLTKHPEFKTEVVDGILAEETKDCK
jgi:hypothetical protein